MTNTETRIFLMAVWMPGQFTGCYWAFESLATARLLAATIQDRNLLIIPCRYGRG